MKRRLLVVASLAMLSIAKCYAGGILISPLVSVDSPRPDLVPKGARVVRDFRQTGVFFSRMEFTLLFLDAITIASRSGKRMLNDTRALNQGLRIDF